jgi:exonuclease III
VEEANKKLDLTKVAVDLDAAAEQVNAECQEEGEELHPDYLHLDTDNIDELEENAVHNQSIYRTIDLPDIKTLKVKTRQLDPFQRNVIDIGVKYAKDIIKAEREFNPCPEPPLVIVHGGAGAGKSHAINSLAEWMQYILQKPGDDINCPYVIKTAFTGAAASLIEGMTLHSAFGFDFGNKHYSLSDKTRDARRNILKNLKMIIIDEISMVKADMLYQLDLRLQEIKEKIGSPFGGISIFCFGDILQLQPVCGKFIFDRPSNPSFYLTFELDSLWHKFSVLNLEINHRQGKDREYAEMLNRVREGKQTENDIQTLEERIRPYGHSDLAEVSLYIVCKKKECARINSQYLNSLPGDEIIVQATHFQQAHKKYKPSICKKEGTVGTSSFMDSLRLKLGCKVILIHNIDTSDGLTNGQLGLLIGSISTEDGRISKFIVQFKNERVGRKSRSNNQAFTAKYPKGTVIEKVSFSYSLSKKASTASTKATLIQYPLKVAHAIAAHKIQGQTIPKPLKVALDISSIFDDAQAHVMLSRVEEFEQIYILESLPEDKIRASAKALAELEVMNRRSINNNPTPWRENNEYHIKIAALNCMNLENNYDDIVSDNTLKESSIIAFTETWLDQKSILNINGYKAHFNSIGPGKGIAIYMKNDTFKPTVNIKQDKMQITKLESPELEVITVYRSEQGSITELLQHLTNMINQDRATVVCGDFNICYQASRNNKITQFLEKNRFLQLMKEATHIRGRHIDHFYFKPGYRIHENVSIYRYTPYYSDHDATCATLTRIPG